LEVTGDKDNISSVAYTVAAFWKSDCSILITA